MNQVLFPDDAAGALLKVRLPNFEPSWVGPNPCAAGFCLGSEDGRLLFTDEDFVATGSIDGVSASNEAVNGVAHSQNWTAVTTRTDINLIGPLPAPGSPHDASSIERGAFGVTVAPSGHFVVPLGRPGIMYVKPGSRAEDPVRISNTEHAGLNLYRVLALPGDDGDDVIVCAGRRGGVGLTSFREDRNRHSLNVVHFDDLDVVDVCSLGVAGNRFAVAAAARDGTIILFRDILHNKTPQTMRLPSVSGTLYRILQAHGDIFLLTSKGLFFLSCLAERFIKGLVPGAFTTDVLTIPIQAADANVVGEKWLVAVGANEVFRFNIEELAKTKPRPAPEHFATQDVVTHPRWQENTFEPTVECMVAAD